MYTEFLYSICCYLQFCWFVACGCLECFYWDRSLSYGGQPSQLFAVGVSVTSVVLYRM
jgi:hypothetical protein